MDRFINQIIQGDNVSVMQQFPDNSIDLTVTSPPYDNLRTYKGFSFNFEEVAKELCRITKPGGVVVWVVGDATIKGSETGTSFRHALYFKEIGFNLHDTMIWRKPNPTPLVECKRYWQAFEYMFVLSKGPPRMCNYILEDCKTAGKKSSTFKQISTGDSRNIEKHRTTKAKKIKMNVWDYTLGYARTGGHPAIFPEQLANDHILSWSNPGDLVFDPFVGSGTTCKMALLNGRNYIGIDISEEYCDIARERVRRVRYG